MSLRPATLVALLLCAGPLTPCRARAAEATGRVPAPEPRAELLRSEGVRHYQAREYYQALRAFEEALGLVDGDHAREIRELISRTRSALGVELFNAGEIRQATTFFREALRESDDAWAHFGLGFVHYVKLEDASALDHLREAVRLEPSRGTTHKLLALLEYRAGTVPQAIRTMEKAVSLDSKDREASALRDRWKTELEVTSKYRERRRGSVVVRSDPTFPDARVDRFLDRLAVALREVGDGFQFEPTQRLVVVLFSPEAFHRATGSFHWVGGVYDGQIKLPLSGGASPSAEEAAALDEAIRHEVAHVVVRQICPECPNWLNEGLAQHFERAGRGREAARALLESGRRRIRFQDVPARLWEVDEEGFARQTYLQGLSFVEYLVEEHHEFRLRLLLDAIHRQGSVAEGFAQTYGAPLDRAEESWWRSLAETARQAPER